MHDPMNVAWEIKRPWPTRFRNHWYWPAIITVWHVDPHTDGSDDSCGWSRSKGAPPAHVEQQLRGMAEWEARYPFYFDSLTKGPGDAAALVWSAWQTLTWRMNYDKPLWRRILFKAERRRLPASVYMQALQICSNETDNILRYTFHQDAKIFRSREYPPVRPDERHHTSSPGVDAETAYAHFRAFWRLLGQYTRPWYLHPRWHIHHWKIQVHSLQTFKRWAFSRCAKCRKGFAWGESPTSHSWHSTGPRWFRSETDIFHNACDGHGGVRADSGHNVEPSVHG